MSQLTRNVAQNLPKSPKISQAICRTIFTFFCNMSHLVIRGTGKTKTLLGSDEFGALFWPKEWSTLISVAICSLSFDEDSGIIEFRQGQRLILGNFRPKEWSTLISVAICSLSFDEDSGIVGFRQGQAISNNRPYVWRTKALYQGEAKDQRRTFSRKWHPKSGRIPFPCTISAEIWPNSVP